MRTFMECCEMIDFMLEAQENAERNGTLTEELRAKQDAQIEMLMWVLQVETLSELDDKE